MPNIVRSARGEKVDFDKLKIKQQLASAPKTTEVRARENFIDQKFKRRLKRAQQAAVQKVAGVNVEPNLPEADVEAVEETKETA